MECPDKANLEKYATDGVADPAIFEHLGICERCNWAVIEAHEWALALGAGALLFSRVLPTQVTEVRQG